MRNRENRYLTERERQQQEMDKLHESTLKYKRLFATSVLILFLVALNAVLNP